MRLTHPLLSLKGTAVFADDGDATDKNLVPIWFSEATAEGSILAFSPKPPDPKRKQQSLSVGLRQITFTAYQAAPWVDGSGANMVRFQDT